LQKERIQFSGWQKCKFLSRIIPDSNKPKDVIFYTKIYKGILNPNGVIWIYAVDLKQTGEKLIYPKNGLGIQYNPNAFCLLPIFIVFMIIESLTQRFLEQNRT